MSGADDALQAADSPALLENESNGLEDLEPAAEDGEVQLALLKHGSDVDRQTPRSTCTWTGISRPSQSLRLVLAVISVGVCRTSLAIGLNLLVPFFPVEAEKKVQNSNNVGLKAEIGLVFGISKLVEIFLVPFIAKDLPNVGSKNLAMISAIAAGASVFLFAFVNDINTWTWFLALSCVDRALQGLATGGYVMATYSLLVGLLPNAVGRVSGLLEGSAAVGWSVGPLIGGVLFDFGGFAVPFFVGGSVTMALGLVLIFTLPADVKVEDGQKEASSKRNIWAMLLVPWVWVACVNVFLANVVMAAAYVCLPQYFHSTFHTRYYVSGLALALMGVAYTPASLCTGYIVDRGASICGLELAGFLLCTLACLLVGPAQFLKLAPALSFSFIATAFVGAGVAILTTCGAPHLTNALEQAGFGPARDLRFAVSGFMRISVCAGCAVGPVALNALTAVVEFRQSMAMLGLVCFLQGMLIAVAGTVTGLSHRREKWWEVVHAEVLLSVLTPG